MAQAPLTLFPLPRRPAPPPHLPGWLSRPAAAGAEPARALGPSRATPKSLHGRSGRAGTSYGSGVDPGPLPAAALPDCSPRASRRATADRRWPQRRRPAPRSAQGSRGQRAGPPRTAGICRGLRSRAAGRSSRSAARWRPAGRGPDRPAGDHAGRGAGGRLQEQPAAARRRRADTPRPICASSPPTAPCCDSSIRGGRSERRCCGPRCRGSIEMPDELLDRHAAEARLTPRDGETYCRCLHTRRYPIVGQHRKPSMALNQTSDTAFEQDVLKSSTPVLVDFWAEWCGPCKLIAPHLEAVAAELGDKVQVIKVNIDEKSADAHPVRCARHPDPDAVQERRGGGHEGRRLAEDQAARVGPGKHLIASGAGPWTGAARDHGGRCSTSSCVSIRSPNRGPAAARPCGRPAGQAFAARRRCVARSPARRSSPPPSTRSTRPAPTWPRVAWCGRKATPTDRCGSMPLRCARCPGARVARRSWAAWPRPTAAASSPIRGTSWPGSPAASPPSACGP